MGLRHPGRIAYFDGSQLMEAALGLRLTRVATAGLIALLAAGGPVMAAEPSVAGLWQKIDDETGKTVIWFLFVENGPAYEVVRANAFHRPGERPGAAVCPR